MSTKYLPTERKSVSEHADFSGALAAGWASMQKYLEGQEEKLRAQMKIVEALWSAVSRSDKGMAMQQKTIEGLELTATLSSFRVLIYSTCMISLSCTNSL